MSREGDNIGCTILWQWWGGSRCPRTNCDIKVLERKTGFAVSYALPLNIHKVSEGIVLLIREFLKGSSGMRDVDRLKDGKPQSLRRGLRE